MANRSPLPPDLRRALGAGRAALVALAAGIVLGPAGACGARRAEAVERARADFSGGWQLNDALSQDPLDTLRREEESQQATGFGSEPGRGGRGGSLDVLPPELLDDVHRLVIVDDGHRIRVARGPGKVRVLVTDGVERELDEGDGPVRVTARRKGARGEKVLVRAVWTDGRELKESWELLDAPRRLVVDTRVVARRSVRYKRVYDPGSAEPFPTPTPRPAPTPLPGAEPPDGSREGAPSAAPAGGGGAALPSAPPAGLAACSIRPPRQATQDELGRLAKVSQAAAQARAVTSVAPRQVSSIITSDVEVDEGCLAWSFVLRFGEGKGAQEVLVDAGDGKVLTSEFLPPRTPRPGD